MGLIECICVCACVYAYADTFIPSNIKDALYVMALNDIKLYHPHNNYESKLHKVYI